MLPPAPGRFSTTMGWPRRTDSHWPIKRATTSTEPPGAKPTTTRTGRDGYVSAQATREIAGSVTAPAARCRSALREGFIICLDLNVSSHGAQYARVIVKAELPTRRIGVWKR